MSELAGQPLAGAAAILMAVLWGCAASVVPFLRYRWRATVFWSVVITGVPVLGWLTFVWGPMIGIVALALGILTLTYSPLLWLRRHKAVDGLTRVGVAPAPVAPAASSE